MCTPDTDADGGTVFGVLLILMQMEAQFLICRMRAILSMHMFPSETIFIHSIHMQLHHAHAY